MGRHGENRDWRGTIIQPSANLRLPYETLVISECGLLTLVRERPGLLTWKDAAALALDLCVAGVRGKPHEVYEVGRYAKQTKPQDGLSLDFSNVASLFQRWTLQKKPTPGAKSPSASQGPINWLLPGAGRVDISFQ